MDDTSNGPGSDQLGGLAGEPGRGSSEQSHADPAGAGGPQSGGAGEGHPESEVFAQAF